MGALSPQLKIGWQECGPRIELLTIFVTERTPMNTASFKRSVAPVGLLIGVLAGAVQAVSAPTENKGVKIDLLSAYELGKQGLDDYQTRQFRVRQVAIAPGGMVAVHSHKDRPGMAYIVTGTLVEHRDGQEAREYKGGDVITETTDVNHWVENKTSDPVVIIAIDLFKE
jgi:quercetin dioxygenase-like cupin family protein